MFEISIEGGFEAAHNLRNYRGKCENLHGHNYGVRVYFSGNKLDGSGMLLDFIVLKKKLEKITENLDHKYLNEVKPFDRLNPTAENIARYIFGEMKKAAGGKRAKISRVSVRETERNCATYYEKR